MPSLTVLSCPVCAAPLRPDDPRCAYCGSVVVIRSDLPRLDPHLLNKTVIDESIVKYRLAVRRDNNDETAHYGLGVAYYNLGLLDEAAEELTQAARLMPENPHIQTQLGVVFADLSKKGQEGTEKLAWDRLNRALLLQPKLSEAIMLKVELHLRKHEYSAAVTTLRELALEQPEIANPKIADILLKKADTFRKAGAWSQTVATWREAALAVPDAVRQPIATFLNSHQKLLSGFRYVDPRSVPESVGQPTNPAATGGPIRRYVLSAIAVLLASCVVFYGNYFGCEGHFGQRHERQLAPGTWLAVVCSWYWKSRHASLYLSPCKETKSSAWHHVERVIEGLAMVSTSTGSIRSASPPTGFAIGSNPRR